MSNLKFDSNWRRTLLLKTSSGNSIDIDSITEYISLNTRFLPEKLDKFCKKYSFDFGFDYDPYSYLVWPMHDEITSSELSVVLNNSFPKCANVVKKTLVEAHGLVFTDDNRLKFE